MLQTICNDIGKIMLEGCANAGRMMLLFTDTLKRISKADEKETVRQMAKLGADSLPIVMMTILFTGMVFSVQTAKEFVRFGASSSVGGIVAIAMGRELVPVLTGVVVAGRIGAAIAAEIGTLKVMATNPTTYLVVPRFLAIVLMMPVLIVFANTIGNIGGWLVSHYYAGISTFTYINSIKMFAEPFDMVGGMLKSAVFGGIIAIVACYKGLGAKQGAEGVGIATTGSVVLSIVLIFITNYFLSILLYV